VFFFRGDVDDVDVFGGFCLCAIAVGVVDLGVFVGCVVSADVDVGVVFVVCVCVNVGVCLRLF